MFEQTLRRHFSWDALEADFIQLYVEVFREAEIRELIEFYETELGQKFLQRMPETMQRLMMITQLQLQDAMPDIMKDVEAWVSKRSREKRRRNNEMA